MRTTAILAALLIGSVAPLSSAQQAGATSPQGDAVFAVVAGRTIGAGEYDSAWVVAQRQKFYHRKAPEAEVAQLRREVGDQLINQVLLEAEARRRGIEPDRAAVSRQIAQYEQRYRDSPQWPRIQAEALPALRERLEQRSAIERLESEIRKVPEPAEPAIRAYYDAHPEQFTEPAQVHVSLILLKVSPSAPRTVWEKAEEEAKAIRDRIARGARFEDLARLHSADPSAEKGGDLGFVHSGVLPGPVAAAIEKLAPGAVSEPVMVLEGMALVRLEARKPPKLHAFPDVRERAAKLWQREESERRWDTFVAGLRSNAAIQIVDAGRYPAAQSPARK